MSADYYDPHPFVPPDRPVLLLGQPGSGVHLIGRALSGLTGWSFQHVERMVEATVGRSRGRIAVEEGMDRVAALDLELLERAIDAGPAGVVTSDPLCLVDRAAWARVAARAHTIHVDRPSPVLLAEIERQRAESPGSLPDFVVAAPCHPEDLDAHLAERASVLSGAETTIRAEARAAFRIAGELRDLIGVQPA